MALTVLAAAVGVALMTAAFFGHVSGEEFAAATFTRRSYAYLELPGLGIQVTPLQRSEHRGELEQVLVQEGFIAAAPPSNRWDLVVARRHGAPWLDGDAGILCQYLDARDNDDGHYWLHWTRSRPALARIFWPKIAHLAQQELYLLMPALFRLAEVSTERVAFELELQRTLRDQFSQWEAITADIACDRRPDAFLY